MKLHFFYHYMPQINFFISISKELAWRKRLNAIMKLTSQVEVSK